MRKSLIITAALLVSSLFAGSALADETSRGAERPGLKADRSDGARAYAEKLRERNDYQGRAASANRVLAERKLDNHRQKGDMVDEAKLRTGNARDRQARSLLERTVHQKRAEIQDKAKKRGDVQSENGNRRSFTVANDRKGHAAHGGPKTIVDVMARRELLKFLSATGVKINCSLTGTCVEETTM